MVSQPAVLTQMPQLIQHQNVTYQTYFPTNFINIFHILTFLSGPITAIYTEVASVVNEYTSDLSQSEILFIGQAV